jgi:ABC-type sugar transport system ATPase subunit
MRSRHRDGLPELRTLPAYVRRENIAYGLRVRRTPKQEIATRVASAAKMLGLEELLGRRPAALSGTQRQRVAMAARS